MANGVKVSTVMNETIEAVRLPAVVVNCQNKPNGRTICGRIPRVYSDSRRRFLCDRCVDAALDLETVTYNDPRLAPRQEVEA